MTTTSQEEWASADPIWTTKDIAHRLGVHQRTVMRWIAEGKFEAIRLGGPNGRLRIRPCDVRAFCEAQKVTA